MTKTEKFDPYHVWLGIRKQDRPPHHYRLLGIGLLESDPSVIENAADRQMAHLRAVSGGRHREASQQLLNEISAAKVCLLDPQQKATYDRELVVKLREKKARLEQTGPEAPPAPPAQPVAVAQAVPVGQPMAMGQAVAPPPAPGEPEMPPSVGKSRGKTKSSVSRTVAKRKRQQSKSTAVMVMSLGGIVTAVLLIALVVVLQQSAESKSSKPAARTPKNNPPAVTRHNPRPMPAPTTSVQRPLPKTPARVTPQTPTTGTAPAGWPTRLDDTPTVDTAPALPPVDAPGVRVGT